MAFNKFDKFQDSSYFDFFWVVNMVTVKFCVQIHFPLIVRFLKLTFLWLSDLQDNFPLIVRFSKWSFLWLSDFQNYLSSDCPIFKMIFPLIVRYSKRSFLWLSDLQNYFSSVCPIFWNRTNRGFFFPLFVRSDNPIPDPWLHRGWPWLLGSPVVAQ